MRLFCRVPSKITEVNFGRLDENKLCVKHQRETDATILLRGLRLYRYGFYSLYTTSAWPHVSVDVRNGSYYL